MSGGGRCCGGATIGAGGGAGGANGGCDKLQCTAWRTVGCFLSQFPAGFFVALGAAPARGAEDLVVAPAGLVSAELADADGVSRATAVGGCAMGKVYAEPLSSELHTPAARRRRHALSRLDPIHGGGPHAAAGWRGRVGAGSGRGASMGSAADVRGAGAAAVAVAAAAAENLEPHHRRQWRRLWWREAGAVFLASTMRGHIHEEDVRAPTQGSVPWRARFFFSSVSSIRVCFVGFQACYRACAASDIGSG